MTVSKYVSLRGYQRFPEGEMLSRSSDFYEWISKRRTIRDFSGDPVPAAVIKNCIKAAGTSPSGANQQPWHFVAISNPGVKHEIRLAAEREEREFYERRAPEDWLHSLEHFETDAQKPFLEIAPWLIAIFAKKNEISEDGSVKKHYYVTESVGIATGILITALHKSGLTSLTHTPSPMNFLNEILKRPSNERPFLLLVTGYPVDGIKVPLNTRKEFDKISTVVQ